MKISVIIPCYNEEKFIGQAIGSLLEQSRMPDEIIVVDDGSDDRSTEIVESFGEPVELLFTGGKGAPEARNMGARHASGEALMFFDADDVLGPTALEALLNHLEYHQESVVACPWYRLEKIGDQWICQPRECSILKQEKDYLSGWIRESYHPPCSVLWSRAAYEKTGGWDPEVSVNQDGDLMMRALCAGAELHITDQGAAFYRRQVTPGLSGQSQSSRQYSREGRESQVYVLKKIIHRLEERGKLGQYRYPITEALTKTRRLCMHQYPEVAEECSVLIQKYGDPKYQQMLRKVTNGLSVLLRKSKNKTTGVLEQVGLRRLRNLLAVGKNTLFHHEINNENKSRQIDESLIGMEIRYGIHSSKKNLQ